MLKMEETIDGKPEGAPTQTDHVIGAVESVNLNSNHGHILKPFTTLSAMSIGANTTNSAIGVILTLSIWLPYGGPPFTVYSYIAISFVGLMTAVSLSELASAMPDAGGQFIWVAKLSPPRYRRFLSYFTALTSWAGAVCTGASATLACPELVAAVVQFLNPDVEVQPWKVFLGFQAVLFLSMIPGLFERVIPKMGKIMMFYTAAILIVIIVSLFAATPHRQTAGSVFTGFSNESGWPAGLAVLIGFNSPNWCFSCLDTIVHIAEEVPHPERNIPKAIMWTIPIGLVTGLLVLLAALFNKSTESSQGAYFQIAYASFGDSEGAAIAFQTLIFISAFSAQAHIHVWQSRLAWTIGINQGFPFSQHLSKIVGGPFQSPVWATLFSATWTAVLGFVYLGSRTAFSSLISCGILFQYFSYCVPVLLMLIRGRSQIAHGPFWYPSLGYLSNVGLICWTVTATVFYSFPYDEPVVVGEMNYVSVILCGFLVVVMAIWMLYARKRWTVPKLVA
ncbi:choline transport protein [Ilyonectria robusta]